MNGFIIQIKDYKLEVPNNEFDLLSSFRNVVLYFIHNVSIFVHKTGFYFYNTVIIA